SKYSTSLPIQQNEAIYLANVQDFIFTMVYQNYHYVDSVLKADSISVATAKNNNSDLYYSTLWNLTKNFTGKLFSNASETLASVMYTAWVNAGSPPLSPTLVEELNLSDKSFSLSQNYPNPFNPSTIISYQIAPVNLPDPDLSGGETSVLVNLKIFDFLGNEIATLVNEEQQAGNYSVKFDATNHQQQTTNSLPSGVYFYQLRAGDFLQTKKMIYLK
ncbi:MAG: T9SS type A sorting domain-containing protein, partial [Ignavibacteriaceae bacterium]